METDAATLNLGARPPRTQLDAPRGAYSEPIWLRAFILSAGGILLAAALIRFLIAASNSQVLSLPDPMIGIPLRIAVLIAGAIELAVACVCLLGKRPGLQIGLLIWLGTVFIIYRIGLLWTHCLPQGTGLGSLTDPLQLSRGATGYLMELIPCYLVLGGYVALFWLLFSKASRTARRMAAPQRAGRHDAAGLLKMSCPACNGHIEFPAHALGQKIPCPHCAKSIALEPTPTAP